MSERRERLLIALLVLVAVLRVVSTYRVFSETVDEPYHVGSGLEWLTTRHYDLEPEHPPLARGLFALGARMEGVKLLDSGDRLAVGNAILYSNEHYSRNLALARAGNLPFLIVALVIVAVWTRRLFGGKAAMIAVALLGALPLILAHAGLATTDMAAAAMTIAALFAFARWLESPTIHRTLLLGIAIGVGLLVKFSFPIYFAVGAIVFAVVIRRRPRVLRFGAAIAIALLIVWAGYKFDAGNLNDVRLGVFKDPTAPYVAAKYAKVPGYEWVRADIVDRFRNYGDLVSKTRGGSVDFVDWAKVAGYPSPLAGRRGDTLAGAPPLPRRGVVEVAKEPFRRAWQWAAVKLPLPAPWFLVGFEYATWHAGNLHPSFFLGEHRDSGWWYYFPVIVFFKTPIAFLLLAIAGVVLLIRSGNREAIAVAIAPLAMFAPAMASTLNIGVRHILPIFPLLAIAAAFAATRLPRVAAVVLLGWFFVAGVVAHPDYLAYFNETARHPERIALDSNLDWGQDLLRLARVVRERRIAHLWLAYFGTADVARHIASTEALPAGREADGWIAVSEMKMDQYRWLERYRPAQRIGKSIRLYFVPPRS
jgi:hypothetical protein